MTLILDTHVLIWLAEGMRELPPTARNHISAAARADGLKVSAISFWEIAMLDRRGRISLVQPVELWRQRVLAWPAFAEVPVTGEIGVEAAHLPTPFHGDPADRMIVATARLYGWRLATRDRRLLAHGAAGHVNTLKV